MRALVRTCLIVALMTAAFPAAADAQIYAWRDPAGNLVLSDRPKDPSATTFSVAGTGQVRTTRQAIRGRSSEYDALIEEHAADHGVDVGLVRAVIQAESAFNPRARSVKGAMGLMQLMPATAAQYGVDNPYDPAQNIRGGVAYLRSLLTKYSGNQELALAAYNAGPEAVEKYGAVPPYRETRNYIDRIRRSTNVTTVPPAKIYRSIEIVNGREVVRYSNVRTPGSELMESASRR
jgi:soluble lytic murein transglycosylase-like protein